MTPAKKEPALILDLGGAPPVPHAVTGLPGMYSPDRPTPVGGIGEPTLEQAKTADANPGVPVKLVEISASEVQKLREQSENDRRIERGLQPRPEPEE